MFCVIYKFNPRSVKLPAWIVLMQTYHLCILSVTSTPTGGISLTLRQNSSQLHRISILTAHLRLLWYSSQRDYLHYFAICILALWHSVPRAISAFKMGNRRHLESGDSPGHKVGVVSSGLYDGRLRVRALHGAFNKSFAATEHLYLCPMWRF